MWLITPDRRETPVNDWSRGRPRTKPVQTPAATGYGPFQVNEGPESRQKKTSSLPIRQLLPGCPASRSCSRSSRHPGRPRFRCRTETGRTMASMGHRCCASSAPVLPRRAEPPSRSCPDFRSDLGREPDSDDSRGDRVRAVPAEGRAGVAPEMQKLVAAAREHLQVPGSAVVATLFRQRLPRSLAVIRRSGSHDRRPPRGAEKRKAVLAHWAEKRRAFLA